MEHTETPAIRTDWTLNKWYEKFIYVIGWINVVVFSIAFTLGFISAFMGEL